MIRRSLLPLFILLLHALPGRAETAVLSVPVEATSTGITAVRGPHMAVFDPHVAANGLLLVSFGGTNSRAHDFQKIAELAASMGYHAVGVDYPNGTISTSCRDSWSPGCFDRFRGEIVTGLTDGEFPPGTLDRANSIEGRLKALLRHLAAADSRWARFLGTDGAPLWDRVVLIGHSQGSGHAAFLAKLHAVRRVVMIAGPQDHGPEGVADWVRRPGLTPPERHFAFLHEGDFFGVREQLEVNRALMIMTETQEEDVAFVGDEAPSRPARIVVSRLPVRDPHMEVMSEKFRAIWAFLLTLRPD